MSGKKVTRLETLGEEITDILETNELEIIPNKYEETLGIRPSSEAKLAIRTKEGFAEIEDALYAGSIGVVDAAMAFGEIDPNNPDKIPNGWIEKYGPEYAVVRHRIAVAACKDRSKSPVAFQIAATVAVGLSRSRALAKQQPIQNLNIVAVQVPVPDMPTMRLPDGKR